MGRRRASEMGDEPLQSTGGTWGLDHEGTVEMDGPRCGIGVPRWSCQAPMTGTIHLYGAAGNTRELSDYLQSRVYSECIEKTNGCAETPQQRRGQDARKRFIL